MRPLYDITRDLDAAYRNLAIHEHNGSEVDEAYLVGMTQLKDVIEELRREK